MKYSTTTLLWALSATHVLGHGVITEIQGANGVNLPGLSVQDGTPRDCASPGCGAEADTSIIRSSELGSDEASALGRTKGFNDQGGGPVDAAKMIALFMDGAGANSSDVKAARALHEENMARRIRLARRRNDGGSETPEGSTETGVKAATGAAAVNGLPTTADDGTISMTFHQVNQDGAGPLKAAIDATSGGTDPNAFEDAEVTQDVPGLGIGGLSLATATDFPVNVQMPQGMTCSGKVAGAENVCIVRVQNGALAGPFGGSAAFTQSQAAKKRAVEYNLAKMRFARGVEGGL